jgi:Domain of unknown function (DUF4773)
VIFFLSLSQVCMNFTYDPMEFAIMMDMNMNEQSIYSNQVSGRDPPPLCLPVPTGPLPLGMDMCVKMFNIFTPGYNLHMCMDIMVLWLNFDRKSFDSLLLIFQARVQMAPIMVCHKIAAFLIIKLQP